MPPPTEFQLLIPCPHPIPSCLHSPFIGGEWGPPLTTLIPPTMGHTKVPGGLVPLHHLPRLVPVRRWGLTEGASHSPSPQDILGGVGALPDPPGGQGTPALFPPRGQGTPACPEGHRGPPHPCPPHLLQWAATPGPRAEPAARGPVGTARLVVTPHITSWGHKGTTQSRHVAPSWGWDRGWPPPGGVLTSG